MRGRSRRSRRRGASCISPSTPPASGPRADRAAFSAFCVGRGLEPLKDGAKQHRVALGGATLRWEQHSEFTTYTWELPADGGTPFHPAAATLAAPMAGLPQPGPLLVALDLHLMAEGTPPIAVERLFDRASLAVAENAEGDALFATDFQADPSGFVRILVVDRKLGPERAGALVQRLIETETYRTLALLGLPETQRLAPSIARIERRLVEVTEEMRSTEKLIDNHRLLDELTALAAELEAGAAASLFRFGASRAYNEIVQLRLQTLGERRIEGYPSWTSFLARRMAPAMRTCITTEERQANLSQKLARAANLLRTRVDVELERQNRDLLKSMNARTRLQIGCRPRSKVCPSPRSAITWSACSATSSTACKTSASSSTPTSPPLCSCRWRCSRSGGPCAASAASTSAAAAAIRARVRARRTSYSFVQTRMPRITRPPKLA